jgi:hypothetical protein
VRIKPAGLVRMPQFTGSTARGATGPRRFSVGVSDDRRAEPEGCRASSQIARRGHRLRTEFIEAVDEAIFVIIEAALRYPAWRPESRYRKYVTRVVYVESWQRRSPRRTRRLPRVVPDAEAELEASARWYELAGLHTEFLKASTKPSRDRRSATPLREMAVRVAGKCVVRRFPYLVRGDHRVRRGRLCDRRSASQLRDGNPSRGKHVVRRSRTWRSSRSPIRVYARALGGSQLSTECCDAAAARRSSS